ncbi:hypothetical protein PAXRUDRAFT_825157 [Paxillus rubicundulus Ve08.2h10]|uniref:Uncharacterized protein n=1 Tax=Paxillus rubicundulus Ve08.2h10 TaxID=930991 RepID=A0A0D0DGR6_9AGAM|nr:hypothetical protein PAXRUDRAFT_825157 [Paxillus rubicundulus Ve08.2h10]
MSLTRAAVLVRRKQLCSSTTIIQSRFASRDSHTHGEHDAHDSIEAGFSTPFWRNTLLLSLAAVAFYKWAPAPDEDVYLTRWLAHYATPREILAELNEKHLLQSQQVTDYTTLQARGTRPGIIRYRYPQSLEQASPHLQPVGAVPEVGLVVARSD